MENYLRPQRYVQKLLSSMEIAPVRNGILEHNWESANRRSTVAQIRVVTPRSKVKDVLTVLHD
jgi:hypothetical protein